jgi:DNA-binding transcriptional regulator LsrR (DeoR family)
MKTYKQFLNEAYSQDAINAIFDMYQKQGKTLSQISKALNIPASTVLYHLRKANAYAEVNRKTSPKVIKQMYDMYFNQDLNCSEIAKRLNTSKQLVSHYIKKSLLTSPM